jgi:hypothetical protein
MTNEEFDRALEAIRQGHIKWRELRILQAAVTMMRELSNIPEDQACEPTHTQIVEFINSLDRRLRRILKQVADTAKEKKVTLH